MNLSVSYNKKVFLHAPDNISKFLEGKGWHFAVGEGLFEKTVQRLQDVQRE